jgi:hypothetical protein
MVVEVFTRRNLPREIAHTKNMGVRVYGKIYCETWHRPLNSSYPNRAAVNKQTERNRCSIGKPRALISNLAYFLVFMALKWLFLKYTNKLERPDHQRAPGTGRLQDSRP